MTTVTSTKTETDYKLTVACNFIGNRLPCWNFELNGCYQSGTLDFGIDRQIAVLCGVALAAKTLPKGCILSIVVSDYELAKFGNQLAITERAMLPFVRINSAHRPAWESVHRLLEDKSVVWRTVSNQHPSLFDTLEQKAKQTKEVAA